MKSHACANITENIIRHFSVTIDCVRFLIRGFLLFTYSMCKTNYNIQIKRLKKDLKKQKKVVTKMAKKKEDSK